MVDLDTEICVCNSVTVQEMAECIKENDLKTLKDVIENDICPIGYNCDAFHNFGFHNDGINIPLVLSMVKNNSI